MNLRMKCWVGLLQGLCLTSVLQFSFADGGDIIVSRDVKPRVATRAPLVPDPNPLAVNASPNHYLPSGLLGGEVSDMDFASTSSGSTLPAHLLQPQQVVHRTLQQNSLSRLPSLSAGHQGRGSPASLSNQINRSVQQGLAPLQNR